ncbi:MAG TPA: CPBP family glutamic-type intramembrane protease [Kofleriaceae bacterium]|nr:CPBP family glutamic-type intramembrane protease [Kofleriaceae bacterium]
MTGSSQNRPRRRRGPGAAAGEVSPFGHGDIPTSLLLIFPLFLAYEVGVMFSPTVNGVDFVTRWVFAAVGYDREYYLLVHLVLAVGFLALLFYLRAKRGFTLRILPPVVIESIIYALTLGTVIVFVMDRVLGLGAGELGEPGQAVVMSLGAGVHEELVFRLGLMGGAVAALSLARFDRPAALLVALAASAALFSAAHHAGPLGEPFETTVFVYRLLAGVAFGLIFYFRSLAHAVYAHFLYDVYVMVLRT